MVTGWGVQDGAAGRTPESTSEAPRAVVGVPANPRHLTRRAVIAAAIGAGLLFGLDACAVPPLASSSATPEAGADGGPATGGRATASATPGTSEPRSAPSRAVYTSRLTVQRAEPADATNVVLADWRLRVDGLVGKPLELAYDELARFPKVEQTSALHCVEGWSVADLRWEGIRLATLLDAVEPSPSASWVTFDTFPGVYRDSLSLDQARLPDVLLAYRCADAPLTPDLGFPLRLVVPRMYGYKSVKWLSRITLVDSRESGYWERVGYPPDAWLG